jgi:hypothetical protein
VLTAGAAGSGPAAASEGQGFTNAHAVSFPEVERRCYPDSTRRAPTTAPDDSIGQRAYPAKLFSMRRSGMNQITATPT